MKACTDDEDWAVRFQNSDSRKEAFVFLKEAVYSQLFLLLCPLLAVLLSGAAWVLRKQVHRATRGTGSKVSQQHHQALVRSGAHPG